MAGGTDLDCRIKNWANCAWIAGAMAITGCYPVAVYHTRIDMLSRLKKRGVKTLEIELVQTKELAYELSGSR